MTQTSQTKNLKNATQLAELLQVTKYRIYELVRQNMIPHVKIGRQIRFSEEKIQEWIDSGGSSLNDKDSFRKAL